MSDQRVRTCLLKQAGRSRRKMHGYAFRGVPAPRFPFTLYGCFEHYIRRLRNHANQPTGV